MRTKKTSLGVLKTLFRVHKPAHRLQKTSFCSFVLIFIVVSILYPGIFPQDKSEQTQEFKSLLLKELLTPPKKSLAPPKRNIFTRQRAGSGAQDFSPMGDFQPPGPTVGQTQSPEQENTPIEAEDPRINVQYIGYVQSGKRVVALIILEGQTYAVESGDVLETGVTIGEITPDDLEIIDTGSEPLRISLEGEKP
jgi:hypothetical protein